MKKFIDCYIPVTTCNFRCHYCYITQRRLFTNSLPKFEYNAKYIARALSAKRLGGVSHLNLCGGGETLLPPEMTEIIRALLEEGHYLMVVTNGSLNKRFDEIVTFPKELLERLGFKFSFHYLELIRQNKLEDFCKNVQKVKDAGCSFSIEITPNDDLIPHINEIKNFCVNRFGALCHVTIARQDVEKGIPKLTSYSDDEYVNIWENFNSTMFEFKQKIFGVKRKEFCYAGAWSGSLNLGTGDFVQCYCSNLTQNIYKNLDKPIDFLAVGKCNLPHCYNGHAFLTLGLIPELYTPKYSEIRNRSCADGTEWLNIKMKEFLSRKLKDYNNEYTDEEKKGIINKNKRLKIKNLFRRIKNKIFFN